MQDKFIVSASEAGAVCSNKGCMDEDAVVTITTEQAGVAQVFHFCRECASDKLSKQFLGILLDHYEREV